MIHEREFDLITFVILKEKRSRNEIICPQITNVEIITTKELIFISDNVRTEKWGSINSAQKQGVFNVDYKKPNFTQVLEIFWCFSNAASHYLRFCELQL